MELTGRVSLVTGAGIRIGRVIARDLAHAGSDVVIHYYHHGEAADEAVEEMRGLGVRALGVQANLADVDEIAAMFRSIDESMGGLDVLVNNAAVFERTPLLEVSEEDWDFHVDINLKGSFFCSQEAARRMKSRGGGKIVNIADVFGDHPWPAFVPYCVSKRGVVTMTQALARGLAKHNIQVNAIGPGAILFPDDYSEADRQAALDRTPARRQGTPEDIARVTRFLIEGPDYVTGALIPVDGGASVA